MGVIIVITLQLSSATALHGSFEPGPLPHMSSPATMITYLTALRTAVAVVIAHGYICLPTVAIVAITTGTRQLRLYPTATKNRQL
ncbi:uncharacterized protein BDZ83DRAFT_640641 [Colletotrichum acutatum]|uniref:Secreted peptide n=1 Tax=Glomerella acutata TaxID=27357 RepID=A0AAD8UCA2_GLOAC|nr:uncharacterized protein BDZ83DRAFT_640641 [Colletotrichum acutatum]KAK1710334.1 hypothetical protein BDZ83DRAFT_640641 [Colletotrichum acutatum]